MTHNEKKASGTFSENDLAKQWEDEDFEHVFDDIERDEAASLDLQSSGLQFSPDHDD